MNLSVFKNAFTTIKFNSVLKPKRSISMNKFMVLMGRQAAWKYFEEYKNTTVIFNFLQSQIDLKVSFSESTEKRGIEY